MTAPAWPFDDSVAFLLGTLKEMPQNNVIRTNMDTGLPKQRQRFTAITRTFTGTILLTRAQIATLDSFWLTDCKGGALRFSGKHPRTHASGTLMRFVGPPSYDHLAGTYDQGDDKIYYDVALTLEVLP